MGNFMKKGAKFAYRNAVTNDDNNYLLLFCILFGSKIFVPKKLFLFSIFFGSDRKQFKY